MTIIRGHPPKYRCSNPTCKRIYDGREDAKKCCPAQEPTYFWTHKKAEETPPKSENDLKNDINLV